jgi:hypothetical protein
MGSHRSHADTTSWKRCKKGATRQRVPRRLFGKGGAMATPSTSYFPLTGDAYVDAITNGSIWNLGADRTIYWSISNGFSGEFWPDPGAAEQHVSAALSLYSYYANVNFVYDGYYSNPNLAYQGGSNINVSLDGTFHYFTNTNEWAKGFFPNTNWGGGLIAAETVIDLRVCVARHYPQLWQ